MAPSLLAPKVHELWGFKGWGHREPQICDSSWRWLQDPCKEFFQAIQMSLEGRTSSKEDYSWTLRAHGVCLVTWTCLGSLTPLFFPISPFGMEMPIPCLFHDHSLEAYNLFLFYRFTAGEQFGPGWIISPTSDLDIWMRILILHLRVNTGMS